MPPSDACLMILAPSALEEQLVDVLLGYPQWAPRFTVSAAEGRDADLPLETVAERVKGRSKKILVECIVDSAEVGRLLERLKQDLHAPTVAYWIVPVSGAGRLA